MEPFIGQIILFAGNFAPRGWALCEGQLLSINDNQALFSILGTTYGGDGRTTFALPDLRGRAPIQPGSGPGLSTRTLGQKGGVESVTLTDAQIPAHTHAINVDTNAGTSPNPGGHYLAHHSDDVSAYSTTHNTTMAADAASSVGSGQSHDNMSPFLGVNFIIALEGTYPSRN